MRGGSEMRLEGECGDVDICCSLDVYFLGNNMITQTVDNALNIHYY